MTENEATTTNIDFMHLRSTVGLARQIKRMARRLWWSNPDKKIQYLEEEIEKDIESGEVDKVDSHTEREENLIKKEEGRLFTIMHDELKILHEEELDEKKEDNQVNQLEHAFGNLSDQDRALIENKIKGPLKNLKNKTGKATDRIRRMFEEINPESGEEGAFFKAQTGLLKSLARNRRVYRKIKKLAKRELKDISQDKKYFSISSAMLSKGNTKPDINGAIKTLKIEIKNLTNELESIVAITQYTAILYAKIIKLIIKMDEEDKQLGKLKFPKTHFEIIEKDDEKIHEQLFKHLALIRGLAAKANIDAVRV